jgi:hypothetical protein
LSNWKIINFIYSYFSSEISIILSLFILWNYQKRSLSYSSVIVKIHGKSSSIITIVYINIQIYSIFLLIFDCLERSLCLSCIAYKKKWILQYFFCHENISIETQTQLNKKEKSFCFFSFFIEK